VVVQRWLEAELGEKRAAASAIIEREGPPEIRPSSSTSEEVPMPKPAEIIAALGDVSAIDSYATLRAEMVDLFTDLAEWMKGRNDERQAQIFRKMAATVDTIPYDMLAEFGHNYNPVLLSTVLFLHLHTDAPDYADAHDLMLSLLDRLRRIDLDDPDMQKAIEAIELIFKMGPPNPHAPSDR
jgi:hypothetical protein